MADKSVTGLLVCYEREARVRRGTNRQDGDWRCRCYVGGIRHSRGGDSSTEKEDAGKGGKWADVRGRQVGNSRPRR